jgi:hypothetical protein
MSDISNFDESFDDFIFGRACSEVVLNDTPEYIEHNKHQNDLYEQLKEFLPKEKRNELPHKILRKCSDNNNFLVSLGVQCGYKQGFTEGVMFIIKSISMN